MKWLLLSIPLALMGCAGNPDKKSLLETIEFEDGEIGCARITGQLDIGGNPFTSTNVSVTIVKKTDATAPDC